MKEKIFKIVTIILVGVSLILGTLIFVKVDKQQKIIDLLEEANDLQSEINLAQQEVNRTQGNVNQEILNVFRMLY